MLEKSAEKMTIQKIALSLKPNENITQDMTRTHSKTNPQGWLYNFERACEILLKQKEEMDEEYEKYALRRAEIRRMITRTELDIIERQYVELRYIEGLSAGAIINDMQMSETKLRDIRKNSLKKIGAANK
jgi:DNA-directed RNA polymerase specialized sigma subunit